MLSYVGIAAVQLPELPTVQAVASFLVSWLHNNIINSEYIESRMDSGSRLVA